jgi:hypothetical protein
MTFLKSLWLDAVIGWNEGIEQKAREKAARAHRRVVQSQAKWNALNPHPFNLRVCLEHMHHGVIRCPECHPRAEEAS